MIKVDKLKFTKEIKVIIKKLDDEICYYTNVDISWYDRYSDNSYIYLLKNDEKIVVLTVSNSGYALANKYFKLLKQIDDNHNIFVSKN